MEELRALSIIIVAAPLVGALIAGLVGRYIGRSITHRLTTLLVAVSFALSAYLLHGFVANKFAVWDQNIYVWAQAGNLNIPVGFLLDKLSVLMITVVSFISLMVHIYSIGYMRDDPGYQRFFCYISLFTFAMLMLVMANNFMQLFFGWEGVGLVSYLLIGFWFKKPAAIFAGLKAFIVNRVGDFGFILGIAGVLMYFGSLQYQTVFNAVPGLITNQPAISLICICLFIGAMAKSAQIPLHVWLPDSMEGPTPISALIHAATMVTAGIFMVARLAPLFEHSAWVLSFITIIGAVTCFFMALLGVVQRDIKRIIAYSTLSQLGYMVVALGVSAYAASIFHLVTHAFFKALLFLGAGSVIIAMHHEQDIFKMGNLRKYMPITFITMLIGTLALIGFPGTSGYYSKDLIIELTHASMLPGARLAYYAVLSSVFITALYSFRLLFVVFFTPEHMPGKLRTDLKESPWIIWLPLVLLAIPSLVLGRIMLTSITTSHAIAIWPSLLAALGFASAWLCYIRYPSIPGKIQQRCQLVYKILINKYGFDLLYENILVPNVRKLGTLFWQIGDVTVIDDILVNGTARRIYGLAKTLKQVQTGYLYHYVFAMIVGFFVLLLWIFI